MIYYVCKYTPVEVFAGFHVETKPLEHMAADFEHADRVVHANLCGFGKSVIEAVLSGNVKELVLVNCCDSMRRTYDYVKKTGLTDFLFLMDLPHDGHSFCSNEKLGREIRRLISEYETYSGKKFDVKAFFQAFHSGKAKEGPYIGVLGVRAGAELIEMAQGAFSLPVRNETCVSGREIWMDVPDVESTDFSEIDYARSLMAQLPCRRMGRPGARNQLFMDPNCKGVIYHTIKFCDFYGFEYAEIKDKLEVPVLKIETDYTTQSLGQLTTRIEAFAETIGAVKRNDEMKREVKENGFDMEHPEKFLVAGIDSGSTSTDVVIMNGNREIVSSLIIPTGGGAALSAEKCLLEALEKCGKKREEIARIVTTGYGRNYIADGDESVTEITCHAKGAHYLLPSVRTIIDIGGQDSKAIRVDENGAVKNFLMNDKCAAGTGRFLEMMARTLGLSLEEMSSLGLDWKENVVISSMCTVFAESEVVSLVAQNKALPDIIHGLNNSVAAKVGALAARLGKEGDYILTGGVAKNKGIIKALEEKMNVKLYICEEAQICGAIGAALFALQ